MIISTIGTVINVTSVNFQSINSIDTKEPIKVTDSVIKEIRLSTTADCKAATSLVRLLIITPVLRRSKYDKDNRCKCLKIASRTSMITR